MGIRVADLRYFGTAAWCRDVLKDVCEDIFQLFHRVSEYMPMLSSPAALRGLVWDRTLLTLVGARHRVCSLGCDVAFRAGVLFVASNRA